MTTFVWAVYLISILGCVIILSLLVQGDPDEMNIWAVLAVCLVACIPLMNTVFFLSITGVLVLEKVLKK